MKCVALLLLCVFALSVNASHFRFGTLTWAINDYTNHPTDVTLKLSVVMRYSYFAPGTIVQNGLVFLNVSNNQFSFGDNSPAGSPLATVTSINLNEDSFSAVWTNTHTYPATTAPKNYTASFNSYARLSTLNNNANLDYTVSTRITLRVPSETQSPQSNSLPIVLAYQNQTNTLNLLTTASSAVTYALATPAQQGALASTQPPGLYVNSTSGQVVWVTNGLALGLWNTQIVITDANGVFVVLDFLLNLTVPTTAAKPQFVGPSPAAGSTLYVTSGHTLTVVINVTIATGSVPAIQTGVLPEGAVVSPQMGSNPSSVTLTWTPPADNSETGDYNVIFSCGGVSLSFVIDNLPGPTPPPTAAPTAPPTQAPTAPPTSAPTAPPTSAPTAPPTQAPTAPPTSAPTAPPTSAPTAPPTDAPTAPPTAAPTAPPTDAPTAPPTSAPTAPPTDAPTAPPTDAPTAPPTGAPTAPPTDAPTAPPTGAPTAPPTMVPTAPPTQAPTAPPTAAPTAPPTAAPPAPFCGDNMCQANENCSSCPTDCGDCPMVILSRKLPGYVVTASSFSIGATISLTPWDNTTVPTIYQAWKYDTVSGHIYLRNQPTLILGAGPIAQKLAPTVTSINWDFKGALANSTLSPEAVHTFNFVQQSGQWSSIVDRQLKTSYLQAPYSTYPDNEVWGYHMQVVGSYSQQFMWQTFVCHQC